MSNYSPVFKEAAVQVIHCLYELQIDYFIILWAVAIKGTRYIK